MVRAFWNRRSRCSNAARPSRSRRGATYLVCTVIGTLVRISLLAVGLGRTLKLAEWAATRTRPSARPGTSKEVYEIHRAVCRSFVWLPGRYECLEIALTTYVLLGLRGVPVSVRIGVQAYPFRAHAWVEYQGAPIGGAESEQNFYMPLEQNCSGR